LFPDLKSKVDLQDIWTTFIKLIKELSSADSSDAVKFDASAKVWVQKFVSVYQSKDVTPYLHAFSMHVSQFLCLHGNISVFSQQGLEKSNDLITKYFQHSSNHHEMDSLKQILEKQNRIDSLEEYQRDKRSMKCSICQLSGHNKRFCKKKQDEYLNKENAQHDLTGGKVRITLDTHDSIEE